MSGISVKKIYLFISLLLFLTIGILPAVGLKSAAGGSDKSSKGTSRTISGESFRVLLTESDKVVKVSRNDYIFGVVAAEIGPTYKVEAMKAQAIASYTFALYRAGENSDKKYDITDSPDTDQAYISREQAKKKWGDNYTKYSEKIDSAVSAVSGYRLVDSDNKPIMAAYHAVSAGRTESSLVAWGSDRSYLQPVESVGDLLSPDYLSVRKFSSAELADKLSGSVKLEGDASSWLGKADCSDSGTVKTLKIGSETLTGAQIRSKLGLRSAAFEVSYAEGTFTFKVKGYGHGVGLSQYGANYLASQGKNYEEILKNYYTGVEVKNVYG